MVYDYTEASAGDRLKFYINGARAGTGVLGTLPSTIFSGSHSFFIGTSTASAGFWGGNVDEVSIWSSALSLAEVQEIYNSGDPTDLSNHSATAKLEHWWKMGDDDTFPTTTDSKGSNDGTMQNMDAGDIVEDAPSSS